MRPEARPCARTSGKQASHPEDARPIEKNNEGSLQATGTSLATVLPALRSPCPATAAEALPKRCGTMLDFILPSSFFARCFSRSVFFMLMGRLGVNEIHCRAGNAANLLRCQPLKNVFIAFVDSRADVPEASLLHDTQ